MGLRKPGEVRKVGGQLTQVSKETAQQLGQDVGVAAVTSPMMGASVGANPDQAKMLGASMNMRATIRARTGTAGEAMTKERAERTQDYASQISDEQKAKKAEYDRWIGAIPALGKLDELMAGKVLESLKPKTTMQQQVLGVDWESVVAYVGNDARAAGLLADIAKDEYAADGTTLTQKSLLTKALHGDPLTTEEMAKVEGAFNKLRDEAGFDLDLETIRKNFVRTPEDQLALQIADSKAKQIGLQDLDEATLKGLGLDSDYLDQLFGGQDGSQWKKATFADVKQRIQDLQSNFADVRELERISRDPFASATQRREANKRLRELGVLGKRAAMEKVGDLEKQIEDGDTVRIGDSVFEIEDILEDDDFMEVFREALNDERQMQALTKNNPDLAKWLTENKNALNSQFTQMSGRLAPGTKAADMFRQVPDSIKKDYGLDEGIYNEAIRTVFGDNIGSDLTLTAQQTQTLIDTVRAQTTDFNNYVAGQINRYTKLGFTPEETAGLTTDLGLLSEVEKRSAFDTRISNLLINRFNESDFKKTRDEIEAIYTAAGLTPPALPSLTAAEYADAVNKGTVPSLQTALEAALEAKKIKETKDSNIELMKDYSGLSASVQHWLAGGEANWNGMSNGNAPFAMDSKRLAAYNSFMAVAGKDPNKQAEFRQALASLMGQKDGAGRELSSRIGELGEWTAKNPGIIKGMYTIKDGKWEPNPTGARAIFTEADAGRAAQARYAQVTAATRPAEAFDILFPGAENQAARVALLELYEKYPPPNTKALTKVQTGTEKVFTGKKWSSQTWRWVDVYEERPVYKDVSALPPQLDANQDGILDTPKQMADRLAAQTKASLDNVHFVDKTTGKVGTNLAVGAVSTTAALKAIANQAASYLKTTNEKTASKAQLDTWREGGFSDTYTKLTSSLGTLINEFPELKGLDPAKFSALGKDGQKEIREAAGTLLSRNDTWKSLPVNPQQSPERAGLYKEVFGSVPSRLDFLRAGDGAAMEKEVRERSSQIAALESLKFGMAGAGFTHATTQAEFMKFAKQAAQGKLPGVADAKEFLKNFQNKPATERRETTHTVTSGNKTLLGTTKKVKEVWTEERPPSFDPAAGKWKPGTVWHTVATRRA
jgi:hypothetical protein